MSGHNTVAREDCEISCASHAAEGGRDASAAGERVNAHTANAPIAAFTPASYVRDNVIGLAAFLLALASTVLILPALGVNSSGVLLVADILTLIALGAGFLDYRRKAAFYHELHHLTEQLRQACVLPSLIAEPPFLEGEIAYDVARRLSQLSAEETAALRDDAAAYRRYVELWIHEIKTPIAAIKLMLANHPGPESAKVARELETHRGPGEPGPLLRAIHLGRARLRHPRSEFGRCGAGSLQAPQPLPHRERLHPRL